MMKRAVVLAAILGTSMAARAQAAPVDDVRTMSMRGDDVLPDDGAPTTRDPRLGPGPKHRIIYVNRFGGKYNAAQVDDPAGNDSAIVLSGGNTFVAVPALGLPEATWTEVMACVRRVYGPFAIEITETEPPANVDYIEVVAGGDPDVIYPGRGAGGVSSGGVGCNVRERAVDWAFDVWGNNVEQWCAVIVQESAHSFALDHELNCKDPMTYLPYCGPYEFLNQDVPCGEGAERVCKCGSNTQNSYDLLMQILGPSDDVPPTAMFSSIQDQGSISAGVELGADASDDVRIDRVEFLLDGVVFAKSTNPPFKAAVPNGVTLGEHQLEVRAVDGDENSGGQMITVVAVPQCTQASDCGVGEWQCVDSECLGAVGNECKLHGQCASSLCIKQGSDEFCSVDCAVDSECPDGFQCKVPGEFGSKKCVPASGGGGGCAVAHAGARRRGVDHALWWAMAGMVLGIVVRRRRAW